VNLHEYQAKEILRAHGVHIPPGRVATTPDEAEAIAREYGTAVMVKAQVHAGGRGKAGGVKFCKTPADAKEKASAILGMTIKGLTVEQVLVTVAADIGTEAYVGIIVDRATKKPVFMVSAAGGIDIEEVAATTPEKILYVPVDVRYGLPTYDAMRMGFFLSGREARAWRREDHAAALRRLHGERLLARRDQPARGHAAGRARRSRREDGD